MDVFDNSDIGGSSPIYFVYTKSHSIYPTLVSIPYPRVYYHIGYVEDS